jgi:hypothetical protein
MDYRITPGNDGDSGRMSIVARPSMRAGINPKGGSALDKAGEFGH